MPGHDFVPMHHGTTRIEYFYRKAVENRSANEPEVMETEYRYPGPRPKTKETGILMLADSVEAASKSVASSGKATPKKFRNLIDSIFQARLQDGQLDNCPLTFADLSAIKATFVSMLSGMYHYRVKYPGQDQAEASPPKPALDPPTVKPYETREIRVAGPSNGKTDSSNGTKPDGVNGEGN